MIKRRISFSRPALIQFLLIGACLLGACRKRTKTIIKSDQATEINNEGVDFPEWAKCEGSGKERVSHAYFTLCYSEEHEQPAWVAYRLDYSMTVGGAEREKKFSPDPSVSTGSALSSDYTNSGFDRGHLVPAADMKFSSTAMAETFFMSNISPQHPSLNRGIWKMLEDSVRVWSFKNEEILVATGPVLAQGLPKIGRHNRVSVPKYFYKVLLDYREPELKAIGFIFPNEKCTGTLADYSVSVDSVEKLTGIDFFYQLHDSTENRLERNFDFRKWSRGGSGSLQN